MRFLGAEMGFQEGDARAVGHWLRDRNAPAPEGRQQPHVAHGHGRPAGVRNQRDEMERRYSQGVGCRGEEAEQLRVRCRIVQVYLCERGSSGSGARGLRSRDPSRAVGRPHPGRGSPPRS